MPPSPRTRASSKPISGQVMAEMVMEQGAASAAGKPMLEVRDLNAWYGESHVLHGVSLDVAEGEVVTLLGRNGAGKTTTLKSIMGVIGKRKGSVAFAGQETISLPSRAIARLGIGYVPEERGIYSTLSVEENLMLPPQVKPGGLPVEQIYLLEPCARNTAPAIAAAAFYALARFGAAAELLVLPADHLIEDTAAFSRAVAQGRRLAEEGKPFPDLVVIDGGRGQIAAALKAFVALDLQPPALVGLAKKHETIIFPDERAPLNLPVTSPALQLLQRLRDEAHRFANTYNADLRSMKIRESVLDDFPGLGPVRRAALMERFGDIDRLRRAREEQIAEVDGFGPKLAGELHDFLHREAPAPAAEERDPLAPPEPL